MSGNSSSSLPGVLLMAAAAAAILAANSPLATGYFTLLQADLGPLSVRDWVDDCLMAAFFLLVGLEIRRELRDGSLASWPQRLLPGMAAAGGMAAPALIYVLCNRADPAALRGWAIPSATDIAFALAVLALARPRAPSSLRTFLSTLAVLDDLGAVLIIALFYAGGLAVAYLAGAAAVVAALVVLNRCRIRALAPYLLLGAALWYLLLRSGIHATLAGVVLALTVPAGALPRLERALQRPVSLVILPLFGLLNAGVDFGAAGGTAGLGNPVTVGVAAGLLLGKSGGVIGTVWLMVRSGHGRLPHGASWPQTCGVALLCGVGFTMSLFITLLAFDTPAAQDSARAGILLGSLLAGSAGWWVLRRAR